MKLRLQIILITLVLSCQYVIAQNIALKKSYELSASPNYQLTAAQIKGNLLTDGIFTSTAKTKSIWRSPTTMGWQSKKSINIIIDLGQKQPIGNITFNTVQETRKGIYYPSDAFVFLSNDNEDYAYVGNILDGQKNLNQSYEVRKFSYDKINLTARYVMIEVLAKGSYIFCDEIQVMRGNSNNLQSTRYKKNNIRTAVDSLLNLDEYKKSLKNKLNQVSATSGINNEIQITNKNLDDLKTINDNLNNIHAQNLKKQFKSALIIEQFNPWESISPFRQPKTDANILDFQYTILNSNSQYGAFILTNAEQVPQKVSFNITNGDNNIVELFKMEYIAKADHSQILDPLVPLKDEAMILPGISQPFLFKITGKGNGSSQASISVTSNNTKKSINIQTKVLAINTPQDDLNAVNWSYLNYPMLTNRRKEATLDLQKHHINTYVVSPSHMPKMGQNDFSKTINYLSSFKGVKNILLFANYNSPANSQPDQNTKFMSTEWKAIFTEWYNNFVIALTKAGYSSKNIYFYPFDEVRTDNITKLKSFYSWTKKAIPDLQLYATINNAASLKNIAPIVDIAQISERLTGLPQKKQGQFWSYATNGTSTSSPYQDYRLMSWRAYVNGLKGIGFWNYADMGSSKDNLVTATIPTYTKNHSIIYTNKNDKEIISSRRWEAFSLGIEDYRLLLLYEKKNGVQKTKELANRVISNSDNYNMADEVRAVILRSL